MCLVTQIALSRSPSLLTEELEVKPKAKMTSVLLDDIRGISTLLSKASRDQVQTPGGAGQGEEIRGRG